MWKMTSPAGTSGYGQYLFVTCNGQAHQSIAFSFESYSLPIFSSRIDVEFHPFLLPGDFFAFTFLAPIRQFSTTNRKRQRRIQLTSPFLSISYPPLHSLYKSPSSYPPDRVQASLSILHNQPKRRGRLTCRSAITLPFPSHVEQVLGFAPCLAPDLT